MKITHNIECEKLWLSQEKFTEQVLERFNMQHAKPISSPLASHFKFSRKNYPHSEEEREDMSSITYSTAIGSLMYPMVSTRPDIVHVVSVVSRYLSNPLWDDVK